ncbi:hypothetical protein PACTADRAFT_49545 [Pachysolen tannophilus NRRL Y-2460]|uniref:Glycosyltransferase family 71 protein n=1 Tax=Pachysolen tannophilus NRRL Y-2460 TaxID=669874 RepID=A0A1E4TWN9_PACTA|nr:hypothetical protein PACTADRAFT_49545 [Pachysolen tannophilus NRRL Y-2460]
MIRLPRKSHKALLVIAVVVIIIFSLRNYRGTEIDQSDIEKLKSSLDSSSAVIVGNNKVESLKKGKDSNDAISGQQLKVNNIANTINKDVKDIDGKEAEKDKNVVYNVEDYKIKNDKAYNEKIDSDSVNNDRLHNEEISKKINQGIQGIASGSQENDGEASSSSSQLQNNLKEEGKDTQEIINKEGNTIDEKENEVNFYTQIFELISKSKPSIPALKEYVNGHAAQRFHTETDIIFSEQYLNGLLKISDEAVADLKKNHKAYLDSVLAQDYQIFGDPGKVDEGTKGIVIVGGSKFNLLALINIEYLKILKSEIPVEVFIGSKAEYDSNFCDNILPKIGSNIRCNLLWKEITNEKLLEKFKINGYQYKTLALLTSKFEKVLFLDADNVPVSNPDYLLDSKLFEEYGLVLWPDAWARTTSPKYYEIADIAVGDKPIRGYFMDKTEFNFHDLENTIPNPSSESGMILVDKKLQSTTLYLSLYYNIFGPDYYYPLFTQGGAGEGDKETFIAAAHVLKQPYYQVKKAFAFIGYHEDNSFHSKALGQYDCVADHNNYLNGCAEDPTNEKYVEPSILFMHLSYPKLIPNQLIDDMEYVKSNGEHRRLYRGSGIKQDFELEINEIFDQLLCENYDDSKDELKIVEKGLGKELTFIKDKDLLQRECDEIFIPHVDYLRENPEQ